MKENNNKNKSFFQFNDPILTESLFSINKNYHKIPKKQQQLKVQTMANRPEFDSKIKKYKVIVGVRVSNNANFENMKEDIKSPFFLSVIMQSTFYLNHNLPKNNWEQLIRINAPTLLIGYIRPYITELTMRTQFPTQYIPFIDFNQKNKK